MLMRTRYDKDREPTMVARDELAKALRRSHGSEADAAARGSATPVSGAERCSAGYALSPDEPRSDARDDARRSGLSATDDDSFGKADPGDDGCGLRRSGRNDSLSRKCPPKLKRRSLRGGA